MEDAMFDELTVSVHEGGAILRGEVPPARKTLVESTDAQQIREDANANKPAKQQSKQD